jgi:hypothetical protein
MLLLPLGSSNLRPRASLSFNEVYSRLDQLRGFRVPHPDDLETRLCARVFNPDEVAVAQLSADAGEQGTASAEIVSNHLLRENFPGIVPASYAHDKAFVFSRLPTLFHIIRRVPSIEVIQDRQYPITAATMMG